MLTQEKKYINIDKVSELGFDPKRLTRVVEKVKNDISNGKCHGTSMIVARHGNKVLDLLR